MKPKRVIIELGILAGIYLLTCVIWPVFFGIFWGNATLDINLHYTYFVMSVSPWQGLAFWTFSLISTFIYFIRAIIKRYKNNLVNTILIGSSFLLIITLIKIYRMILLLEQTMDANAKGWTIYPPLSGLSIMPAPKVEHPHFDNYMFIPITIFMLILVASSILTGKNWKTNTHEQHSL